jgi:Flp pilus assembly protein TadD
MYPPEDTRPNGPAGASGDERLDERLSEAAALADQGQWGEAFELLLAVEEAYAEDARVLCMLAVAADACGAGGMAYDYFRRCVALEPLDPELLATAGRGLARWDDPDAERVLRLAALTGPNQPAARASYGSYLAQSGMLDAGIAELEAALVLESTDPDIRYQLAVAYLLAGRGDEGIAELAETASLAPDDTWVQAVLGLALADAGRMDEAAEQLHAASHAREADWEVQLAAALAAAAEEWSDHAWDALARADLAPDADARLIREVEETIEDGPASARHFLQGELAAPVLRARLLARD